jgi:hypothetical protein
VVRISKVMKASSAPKSKSSPKAAKEGHKYRPSKPIFIDMGQSIPKEKDLKNMKEHDYFEDKGKVRFVGVEATLKPKSKEVVFRSFFQASLRLPM